MFPILFIALPPLGKSPFLSYSNIFFSSGIGNCILEKMLNVLKEKCRLKQQSECMVFVVIYEI